MTATSSPPIGWRTQGVLLGVLAALGVAVAVADSGPSAPGLAGVFTGIVAGAYWIWFGVYALISTSSFQLLRRSHPGFLLGNIVLAGAAAWAALEAFILYGRHGQRIARNEAASSANETMEKAARCGSLESWRIEDTENGPLVRMKIEPSKDGTLRVGAIEGVLLGRGLFEPADQKTRAADYSVRANTPIIVDIALRYESRESGTPFKLFYCCKLADSDPTSTCTYYESSREPNAPARPGTARYPLPPPQ